MSMKSMVLGGGSIVPPCPGDAAILEEACRLAETGRYADYTDIEHLLRFGYALAEARAVLDRYPVRRMLNRRCTDAREQRVAGSDEPAAGTFGGAA